MTENYRQAAGCILLHLEGKETPNPAFYYYAVLLKKLQCTDFGNFRVVKWKARKRPKETALQELLEERS